MSTNFSSNQFESAFLPSRLQNYEIPRPHKERPSMRKGNTQIIANDRGHIVDASKRSPTKGAWGHFVGTWQIPRKPIQLRVTTKYVGRPSKPGSAMMASTPVEERDGTPDKDDSNTDSKQDQSSRPTTRASSSRPHSRGSTPSKPSNHPGSSTRSNSKASNRPSSKGTVTSSRSSNHPLSQSSSRVSSIRSQTASSVPRSSHWSKTNSGPVSEVEETTHSCSDHDNDHRSSQCQSGDKRSSQSQTPCHSGSVVSEYTPQTPTHTTSSRTQSAPHIRSGTSSHATSRGRTPGTDSRPHSRQGSVQASGIMTPEQVYTPSEGSYHTHTGPISRATQCPSTT